MTERQPAAASPPLSKRLRRARMGVETALGIRAQGFFAPYRYAAGVAAPASYGALEAHFHAAVERFEGTLDAMAAVAKDLAAIGAAPPPAPRWAQTWFPGLDGAAAYALTRSARPRRVVEVGSGHSTRFIAQAIKDGALETRQACIDPAPRARLLDLPVDWEQALLSPAHGPLFETLEAGDLAVFDSSHLLFPGTDVDIILNRLLPSLKPGVLIHIHDVFLPDPYPRAWAWRGYNEQNALGPLIASGGVALRFASWYARTRMGDRVAALEASGAVVPPPDGAVETSLWLEKR